MKQKTALALYIFLAVLMLIDFYLIFNVGNPNSLIRPIVPSAEYDMIITLAVSALIAFLSFYVFRVRKDDPVVLMLRENRAYVEQLRGEGKSNEDIADSLMAELTKAGPVGKRTRRSILATLEEME